MPAGKLTAVPNEENSSPEATGGPGPLRTRTRHSRSRGACARCKKRRQKCDEGKPACARCQESGIEECAYTIDLRWGGRAFKSYTANSDIKKYETEPGTFVYIASSKQKSPTLRHPSPPSPRSESQRLSRSLSPLDSATPTEQLLLHHFAHSASKITSCHPTIQTQFNTLLLPMAISYPPLLSALMALSAIHRTSLYTPSPSSSPPFANQPNENQIIYLKASSVTQLRADLLLIPASLKGRSGGVEMRDAVLATALTLCMCEIHSGADVPRSWRLHLEGANAILSSLAPSSASAQPNSQTGLLERWYTSIEALAAISSKGLRAGDLQPASSPAPSTSSFLGIDIDRREVVGGGGEEDVFLDDYFGFSTDLVDAFKEIGALAWERRAISSSPGSVHAAVLSEEDLLAEARSLELRILDMLSRDAASPPVFYPGVREQLSGDVIKEFYLSNEAYQHSALLHIYRRVMFLDSMDERVQGCVERVLGCVEGIEKRGGLSPYIVLTMPLFTAGREAMGEDTERVRGVMRALARETGLRNVWRSLEFLESGWKREGSGAGGVEMNDMENCDFIPY